jgi:hypothetical protein
MAYPQDLQGKYIKYQVDPGVNLTAGTRSLLINGLLRGRENAATVEVYDDIAKTTRGLPWRFSFLQYVGGAVTIASLAGPVMTGPMSGCFLCTYTQGTRKLAHIGTVNTADSDETLEVKRAWLAYVARHDVTAVLGANPNDYFRPADRAAAMGGGVAIPDVVGYFDGGAAYAILLARVPAAPDLLRVVAIKRMTMQPWAAIAAMRGWRL